MPSKSLEDFLAEYRARDDKPYDFEKTLWFEALIKSGFLVVAGFGTFIYIDKAGGVPARAAKEFQKLQFLTEPGIKQLAQAFLITATGGGNILLNYQIIMLCLDKAIPALKAMAHRSATLCKKFDRIRNH